MMPIPSRIIQQDKRLDEWSIVAGYVGSLSHGTYVPQKDPDAIDDKDVMVVVVPPISYYYGLLEFGSRGTKESWAGDYDIVTYEVRKFIRLLEKGNPNVLCMLWLPENCYLKRTPAFEILMENREEFIGKHVYKSFVGYAHGQLHRMTHQKFEGFMGRKRRELVEKFGYDCKNAAHLIRLLRMGIEFLSTGELNVLRHDSAQLLEIKRGEWSLEQVKSEAEKLFSDAIQAVNGSVLKERPSPAKVNDLCIQVVRAAVGVDE